MIGRRGPGLLGTVARTAVIAGTAQATSNAVNRRAVARQSQAADAQAPAAPAPAPAAPASPAAAEGLGDQLAKLADLHAQGLLSAEEFAAAKARLLA